MSFKTWLQRANIPTWLLDNKDALAALQKAYEAGGRNKSRALRSDKQCNE